MEEGRGRRGGGGGEGEGEGYSDISTKTYRKPHTHTHGCVTITYHIRAITGAMPQRLPATCYSHNHSRGRGPIGGGDRSVRGDGAIGTKGLGGGGGEGGGGHQGKGGGGYREHGTLRGAGICWTDNLKGGKVIGEGWERVGRGGVGKVWV